MRTAFDYYMQALFTSYGFNCPLLVGLLQMVIIVPVCYAVARPKLELKTFRAVAPLAIVSVANLVCGLIGRCSDSAAVGSAAVPYHPALLLGRERACSHETRRSCCSPVQQQSRGRRPCLQAPAG